MPEVEQADRLGNPAYRVVLRMYCASQLALLGRFLDAKRFLEEAGKLGGDNVFAETSRHFHSLQMLLDEGELGASFDEQLRRFHALGVCDYHCQVVFILDLYRWIERWESGRRGRGERREIQGRMEAAIAHQNELAGPGLGDAACVPLPPSGHPGGLESPRGEARPRPRYRLLERAERMARQADSAWGLFEVARERARWARSPGDEERAQQEAGAAVAMAALHGWRNRERRGAHRVRAGRWSPRRP